MVPPAATEEEAAVTVIPVPVNVSVTVAVAYLLVSAVLLAVIVTVLPGVTVAGAVYRPLLAIEPNAGLIVQLTPVMPVPVTVAANC